MTNRDKKYLESWLHLYGCIGNGLIKGNDAIIAILCKNLIEVTEMLEKINKEQV